MNVKKCSTCKQEKSLDLFYKAKDKKDGLSSQCSDCKKAYWARNKETFSVRRRSIYSQNLHKKREEQRKRYKKEKQKRSIKSKLDYKLNRQKYQEKNRKSYIKNKEKRRIYFRHRYKTNIQVKLRSLIAGRIIRKLKHDKSDKTLNLLECSIKYLKEYLESQFLPGMTWDNHSKDGWHIDHIIPCASFDLTKEEEQRKCFHYTNLMPRWATTDIAKANNSNQIGNLNKNKRTLTELEI